MYIRTLRGFGVGSRLSADLQLRMPSRARVDFIRFTKGQVQDRRRPIQPHQWVIRCKRYARNSAANQSRRRFDRS
jgi:hypothetical protein